MLNNNVIYRKKHLLIIFIKNENGAILLPFIIFIPFLIGVLFFSFEICQFLQKKAKLSDAIEQAALALTVENNDLPDINSDQDIRNKNLVSSYVTAYLPAETFSAPDINIDVTNPHLVTYNADITISYLPKFLYQIKNNPINIITVNDNGSAIMPTQSFGENTDVVFVTDYSSSMNGTFSKGDQRVSKIEELRIIFENTNKIINENNYITTIGFVPFMWGVIKTECKESQKNTCLHFPFSPKKHKPDGSYLKQYSPSELKKISGLDNFDELDDLNYGDEGLKSGPLFYKMVTTLKNNSVKDKDFLKRVYANGSSVTLQDIVEENINYEETIRSINQDDKTINIPIEHLFNYEFIKKKPLAQLIKSIDNKIEDLSSFASSPPFTKGGTLISAGILTGNKIFAESNNNNKIMIIISDGLDNNVNNIGLSVSTIEALKYSNNNLAKGTNEYNYTYFDEHKDRPAYRITKKLISMGMCEKIKENRIKMVFIGIDYEEDDINWKQCVGEDNFYLVHNAHQLEEKITQALKTENIRDVGRNIPKK